MKTLLVTMMLLLATLSAFPQGKVTFGNDSTRLFQFGDVLAADSAYVGQPIPESPLPSGLWLQAVLYAGMTASQMTLQTSVVLAGANWLTPGRMVNKSMTLTGVPGGSPAYFKVLWLDTRGTLPTTIDGNAWFLSGFWNFRYLAASELFTAVPGTSISYPLLWDTTGPASSTWQSGSIRNGMIPEPASNVMVGLGLVLLFVLRRCAASTPASSNEVTTERGMEHVE